MSSSRHALYTSDELDYRQLITHLSRHTGFPCSLHLRNHFLAPLCAHVPHPSLRDWESDLGSSSNALDPWQVYNDYRPRSQVIAIGDVPSQVRRQGRRQEGEEQEGLWALAIVYDPYTPGWVERPAKKSNEQHQFNSVNLALWLSSERACERIEDVRRATEHEMDLLGVLVSDHLPRLVNELDNNALDRSSEVKNTEKLITLFAVNHSWILALQELCEKRRIAPSACQIALVRTNPCTTFVLPQQEAEQLSNEEYSSRWSTENISLDAIALVQSTNSIAFPHWYVEHHIHNSVMLADGPIAKTEPVYPKEVLQGSPAGWTYSHDDLAIGSLHVAEPYRRNRDSDGPSVGKSCLIAISRKLIDAQRNALRTLDLADLQAPLLADTELGKGPAQSFFRKASFQPRSISTWAVLSIKWI